MSKCLSEHVYVRINIVSDVFPSKATHWLAIVPSIFKQQTTHEAPVLGLRRSPFVFSVEFETYFVRKPSGKSQNRTVFDHHTARENMNTVLWY